MKKRVKKFSENSKKKYYSLSKFEKMMFLFGAIFILIILATVFISGVMNAYPYTPAGGTIVNNDVWQIVDGVVKLINPSKVFIDGDVNIFGSLNVTNNLNVGGNISGDNLNVNGNINITGNVTFSDPIAFSAYHSSSQTLPDLAVTKALFDTEDFDTKNDYNTSNSVFTPKISGIYLIDVNLAIDTFNGDAYWMYLYKNGVNVKTIGALIPGLTQQQNVLSGKAYVQANGTDYFEIYVYNLNGANRNKLGSSNHNMFAAHLIR